MSKPLFQDIVPPEKRSIRKIPVPERRQPIVRETNDEPLTYHPVSTYAEPKVPERTSTEYVYQPDKPKPARGKSSRLLFAIVALACVAGLFFVVTQQAGGAKVALTPRGESVSLNAAPFTALKDKADGELQFQTMEISKDGKLAVNANGEERADVKAQGTIVIYNNYSSQPQVLVANTRFQTPEGLVFRITKAITVPGKKTENGKSVSGSIEATVVADAAGPTYNVGLADFTIPGFKGDPRYEAFYARSKTPIQGGFSGMRKKVAAADEQAAREKIRGELKKFLVSQASQETPDGYVMPENSFVISYESLPNTQTDTGVEINERAVFHGIIFSRNDLAHAVAEKNDISIDPDADLLNAEKLVFASVSTSTQLWSQPRIAFTLNGSSTIVSALDTDKLQEELAGKPRKSLNAILAGYQGIQGAKVTVSPFWKRSFPNDPKNIEITVTDPELSP